MEKLDKIFGELYGAIITNLSIDILKKSIDFELTIQEDEKIISHTLKIKDYDSIFWLEKDKYADTDYNIENCNYWELTAITSDRVYINTDNKWLSQFDLEFNVVIEIWESALLIKTEKIFIDGQELTV